MTTKQISVLDSLGEARGYLEEAIKRYDETLNTETWDEGKFVLACLDASDAANEAVRFYMQSK